eukprot:744047_1
MMLRSSPIIDLCIQYDDGTSVTVVAYVSYVAANDVFLCPLVQYIRIVISCQAWCQIIEVKCTGFIMCWHSLTYPPAYEYHLNRLIFIRINLFYSLYHTHQIDESHNGNVI